MVDEETLGEGMRIAAALGLPVAVHAEDAELIRAATAHALQEATAVHALIRGRGR